MLATIECSGITDVWVSENRGGTIYINVRLSQKQKEKLIKELSDEKNPDTHSGHPSCSDA